MHVRSNAALLLAVVYVALLHLANAARTQPLESRGRGAGGLTVEGEAPAEAATGDKAVALQEASAARKPPKGWRKLSRNRQGSLKVKGDMKCGETYAVGSEDSKLHRCPSECPFFAQDKGDNLYCTFRCVANAEQCKAMNPKTIIADEDKGICRKPMVQSCREYNWDGTDTCKVCNSLYKVGPDGLCYSQFKYGIYGLGIVLLVVVVFLVVWIADLCTRPVTNAQALKEALDFRSCQKLRTPKEDGEGRKLWPLNTNLLKKTVAGPGMMLHFNFQFAVIVWALLIGFGWMVLAAIVDPALFILGTRRFGTPRDNCILVAWGFEKQQALMWSKVLFLVIAYVVTFVCSILYSVRQLRVFQLYDFHHATMKDFVALCEGLPRLAGKEKVEEALVKSIEDATGVRPVGVSVAWSFQPLEEEVTKLVEKDMVKYEETATPRQHHDAEPVPVEGTIRQKLFKIEESLFSPSNEKDEALGCSVQELLEDIETSPCAFAVFNTERDRKKACEQLKGTGFTFEDSTVVMNECHHEPDTVEWQNFGHFTVIAQLKQLLKGFGAIFVALLFWTVVFYLPYAWSVFTFNYDNGQEPGFIYSLAFSMVVVVGNQIMYEVCARVSASVGFRFKDQTAVCYMILFTVACLYNVLVDMVTTYFMAEKIMMELGFRTYYGQKLTEVPTFTERFETYAMQRSLAENTYAYAFPSTYLIPFLLEPIATILLPLLLGVWIVRSHPEIQGRDAEGLVASIPMDMGRYADILLNMVLGILIFYFPGGYTHTLFLAMAGSHAFIYFFDHCRVLRTVPSIMIATMEVDWWCQALLAPVCGLILSCLVFKANRQGYGYQLEGMDITKACVTAFILHSVVHTLLLIFIVPMFGVKPPQDSELNSLTYRDIGTQTAATWFSTNPVYCLRSKKIYKHSPACGYVISGKEHMLKVNEEIGCFFHDDPITVPAKAASGTGSWLAGFKSPGGALFGGNKA
mmetsp:Transcript_73374/g.202517  ORF Transcript_73374/g.202517 Transcript_73374/m.202517 type:complete len:970 (-) Transcript_73374:70-2979(-)